MAPPVAEVNDSHVKLRDGHVVLDPGEFLVIRKGIEHRPVAREETHLLLDEPKSIRHTGAVVDGRTVTACERI